MRKCENVTLGKGGKWWEVSPTLINSGMRIIREKEEKKMEKNERRKTDREEEERGREGKGDFPSIPTIEVRRSES